MYNPHAFIEAQPHSNWFQRFWQQKNTSIEPMVEFCFLFFNLSKKTESK